MREVLKRVAMTSVTSSIIVPAGACADRETELYCKGRTSALERPEPHTAGEYRIVHHDTLGLDCYV